MIYEDYLDNANEASKTARTAWLVWVSLLSYLFVTLSSVNHSDLLLNNPVQLPIVQVDIPLFSFFIFGPVLLLVVHVSLLAQHSILMGKFEKFNDCLKEVESRERIHVDIDRQAVRERVSSYVFSQVIAGPTRGFVVHWLHIAIQWLTFSVLPVLALLYFQITFLPYHDEQVTWIHRIVVVLDLLVLWSLPLAGWRNRDIGNEFGGKVPRLRALFRKTVGYVSWSACASFITVFFSLMVATVPDGWVESWFREIGSPVSYKWIDPEAAAKSGLEANCQTHRCAFVLTTWLFEGKRLPESDKVDTAFGWSRNLIVRHKNIVEGGENEEVDGRLDLRGRNLNYATLDGSDLHGADFSYAKLNGASLVRTRLFRSEFSVAELAGADLRGARLNQSNFEGAVLERSDLRRARLEKAIFNYAGLNGAKLSGARMQEANFDYSCLADADLTHVKASDTTFRGAFLRRADFTAARLRQTSFATASMTRDSIHLFRRNCPLVKVWNACPDEIYVRSDLVAANFREAQLQNADLSNVKANSAIFDYAALQGANLSASLMNLATFEQSDMRGAMLDGARFVGATLRKARLGGACIGNADLTATFAPEIDMRFSVIQQASMYGANLHRADLSSVRGVRLGLQGANLGLVKLKNASLEYVSVWGTNPPKNSQVALMSKVHFMVEPTRDFVTQRLKDLEREYPDTDIGVRLANITSPHLRGKEIDKANIGWYRFLTHQQGGKPADPMLGFGGFLCSQEDRQGFVLKGIADRLDLKPNHICSLGNLGLLASEISREHCKIPSTIRAEFAFTLRDRLKLRVTHGEFDDARRKPAESSAGSINHCRRLRRLYG